MAYTADQLVAAYTNANLGKGPDDATKLTLAAFAQQSQVGGITDDKALGDTLKLVNSTTAVAVATYQFFLGHAPSAAGLDYLVDSTANANDLNDATGVYAKFSQENRFINFAVNLGVAGEGKAAFQGAYANVTNAQVVATAYDNIIGNATATAAGVDVPAAVAYISRADNINFLTSYLTSAGYTGADLTLAVKAALVGQILNIAISNGLGAYANATKALITDLSDGTLSSDNAAGINLFTAYPTATPGQTFNLTTGVDTFVGGGGADVFNANTIGGVSAYGALDGVDGGAGEDTLNIADAATANTGTFTIPAGAGIKNIETINVATTGSLSLNVAGQAGLTKLVATSASTNGNTSNVTVADTVAVVVSTASGDLTVNGGKTAVVTALDGALTTVDGDALTSVTVTTNDNDVEIYGESLVTVTLNGTDDTRIDNRGEATLTTVNGNNVQDDIIVVAGAGERAIAFNLVDHEGNYIEDNNATSVTLNVTGDDAAFALEIDSAETLTVAGDAAVEIDIDASTELTAIVVTNTAGATFTDTLGVDVAFTGGAGADSIVVAATTQAITTGEGDDTVEVLAAPATGGSINAGAGTDTLKLSATLAETLSATTTFAGKIDGFEKLAIGSVGNDTETVNLSNLDNISYIVLEADAAASTAEVDTVTFGALTAGQSVTVAGRTVTASTNLSSAQVAAAFGGAAITGAAVTGTLTGFTSAPSIGSTVALTSTAAGDVTNPASSANALGTAPVAPSVSTTNGTGTTTETADVTFTSLTAGQSVTVDGITITASAGDLTANDVAAAFANAVGANFTGGAATGNVVTFTANTPNANVTNIAVSTAGVAAATAPGVATTTPAIVGSALVLTNLAANATIELTGATAGTVTATLKDASGTADVINLVVNGSSNIVNTGTVTVAGVETVNITTTDSTKVGNPAAASDLNLIATSATKVVVTGNHGVDFTGSTLSALTTLDASGVVGTGATAAAAAVAGAVTFTSSSTNLALTVTTGNGNDVINLSSVTATNKAATISTGAGNDTVTGTASADIINVGAGADNVFSSAGADVITLGAGNDVYHLTSATHSVLATAQTITDFSANTVAQSGTGNAVKGATLATGDRTGDVIDITTPFLVGGATGIKVQVASNAADAQTIIQNISTNDGTLTGIVLDSSTGKVYIDFNDDGNVDSVITLTGVTTLTTASFVTGLV